MVIQLDSCLVRSFRDDDDASIARYANNRKVWINLRDAFPHPYNLNDAMAFIKMVKTMDPQTIFAICVDNSAIGAIGFHIGKDVERISAEIGYWIAEPFWGRGITTQVLRAVTLYAMETYNLSRVFALPFEWNPASCRVLEKAGYQLEGRLRKNAIKDGKIIDQFLYAYTIE